MSDVVLVQSQEVVSPAFAQARPTPWAKKAAVMAELTTLAKRGFLPGGCYLLADDLFEAVRPLLAQHGLAPTFSIAGVDEVREIPRPPTKEGAAPPLPRRLVRVHVTCALVDTDTGERIDEADWPAESDDSDKAIGGASTKAVASWLRAILLVSSEKVPVDGDGDDPPPPPPRGNPGKGTAGRGGPPAGRVPSKVIDQALKGQAPAAPATPTPPAAREDAPFDEALATRRAINAYVARLRIPERDLMSVARDAGYDGPREKCTRMDVLTKVLEYCRECEKLAMPGAGA